MKSVMDLRSRLNVRSDSGFALLEVIVSAAVLGLMALAILSGIDGATNASGREKARSVAAALAEQDQERLRSMPVEQLSTYGMTDVSTVIDGAAYNTNSKVEWVRDDTGGTVSCSNDAKQADYLHITTTVTSNIVGSRTAPVKIDSIVAPNIEYSTTHGSLAVKVVNAAGQPVTNLQVSPTGASSPTPQNTNQQGCAFFQNIATGDYTVTLSALNMVDKAGNPVATKPATVSSGKLTTIQMDYDYAGTVNIAVQTYLPGSANANSPFASSAVRVTGENAANVGWFKNEPPLTAPSTPLKSTFTVKNLFPFSTAYSFYTGKCGYANPTYGDANDTYFSNSPGSIGVAPSGNLSIFVRHPPLNIQIIKDYNSNSAPADSGMIIVATPVKPSGESCVEPSISLTTFTRTISSVTKSGYVGRAKPSESMFDAGVPFGTYTLCLQKGTGSGARRYNYPDDYVNTGPLGGAPLQIDAKSTSLWSNTGRTCAVTS